MITRYFMDLSITRKLVLIINVATIIAVLFASILFGASEAFNYRRNTVEQVATLADVIGTNSTAAITFEDAALAEQVLGSLSANDSIIDAHIYLSTGELMATYYRTLEGESDEREMDPAIEELVNRVVETSLPIERFDGLTHLDAVRPIYFDTELIGYLHLRTSLQEFVATLERIAFVAIGVLMLGALVAYFLSFRLQLAVSRPILELSGLMQSVSKKQDYSIRAVPSSADEIGELMSGFNDMLKQINMRDVQLEEANAQLKVSVDETLQAMEAAKSASQAKSDFLARMSHEIRTPMNGVLGMTELLLASELEGNDRKFAETIQQSGETLLAVINDILDFSKVEAGKLVLEKVDFDICEVVEGIIDLMYSPARKNGIGLVGSIDPDIPHMTHGDAMRVRQVLMNLVGNAIKFTAQGEVVVSLGQRDAAAGGSEYVVAVRDTGIGISSKDASVLFDSFAQADVSTTRKYGGTGLGLAIAKQLVELMGGQIGVNSEPGKGSTFWFTLPAIPAVAKTACSKHALEPLYGVRVLYVDPKKLHRDIFVRHLLAWDVDAFAAGGERAAIETLEEYASQSRFFDVVLINQSHDRTSVSGLVDEIHAREEFNEPGVVIFNDSGSDFGNADFAVAKPVRIEKLHATICKSLQGNKGKISSAPQDSDALQREILSFGLKVLLVEDIPINMQVARHMLKGLGCEVIEATNGREGLDKISLHEPDVVLMDCQMPVMDGYTATRERREYETQHGLERLPIVALTANALAEDRQKCLDAGMDDFVSKPFRKEDLINVLERSVGGAEAVIVDQVQAETVTPANDEGAGPGPVIDKSALDQIADLDPDGSGQLLGSIIDSYLDNAEELVAELGDAIDRSDIEIATRAAHSLKSAAANVGAISFSALCADMERHGRAGDIAAMAAVVDQAKQEHEIAARELANYKTEIAA